MRCTSIPDDFGVKIKREMEKIIKNDIIKYSTERGIDELLRNGELIESTASLTRDGKRLFGVYFSEALEGTYIFRYFFLLTLIDQIFFLLIEAWTAEKNTPLPWTCGGVSLSFGSKAQLKDGDLYDYFVSELVNREVFSLPKHMRDVLPEFCHGITIVWRFFMIFNKIDTKTKKKKLNNNNKKQDCGWEIRSSIGSGVLVRNQGPLELEDNVANSRNRYTRAAFTFATTPHGGGHTIERDTKKKTSEKSVKILKKSHVQIDLLFFTADLQRENVCPKRNHQPGLCQR